MKRSTLSASLALSASALLSTATAQPVPNEFKLIETTVPQIRAALQSRLLSSEELVQMYLARIAAYDDAGPKLNSYMAVNPQALATARALDAQRFLPGFKPGPLHGVPVALKDIVDTGDMPTTGGAIALANSTPPDDAFITRKLREAGAVILGKLTLTEFANFIGNGVPSGYSGLGGYGLNPYDTRLELLADGVTVRDGRPLLSPSGSSSGSGIAAAANLVALTIGTETSGSILSPANANGIVGIKPTVGLVSRDGIIPITADQDTAGPMTRSVTDAAIMLGVIAGYDPTDAATEACLTPGLCLSDYTPYLDKDALRGARLALPPYPNNLSAERVALMEAAIAKMEAAGATVVRIPAVTVAGGFGPGVLNYGQKRDVNAYFDSLPNSFPIQSLADLINFNANPPPPLTTAQTIKYGQQQFINSNNLDISPGSADTLKYINDRDTGYARSRTLIDGTLNGPDALRGTADDFDAVVYSGNGSAGTWARAGYPSIVVPLGFVPSNGVPIPSGISFAGRAFGEAQLIGLGYAFEQLNLGRLPPFSAPALASDTVLRGDVNRDGVVNAQDIVLTAKRVPQAAMGAYDKSDLDGDGRITGADVSALTKLCQPGPGCGKKQ
jgi:amidase